MKKLFFFLRRALTDVRNPFRFNVSLKYLSGEDIWPYGLDYSSDGMHDYYKLKEDENGIIMMSHYIDHKSEESNYYSPVKIAHYALGAYNDYLKTGKDIYEIRFKKHLEFLVNNYSKLKIKDSGIVWTTPSTNPKYNIPMDYISAIVQGLVISALARGYELYKDEKYKELAEQALKIFRIPVEQGGILARTKWGNVYEEYPCLPYSHVVNGFIFSLMGLFDLWKICGSVDARLLYLEGIETLNKLLPEWYTKHWSKYDLRDISNNQSINLATHHYHCLHADQLKITYLQTGEEIFDKYYKLTEKQLNNRWVLMSVYFKKFQSLILKIK